MRTIRLAKFIPRRLFQTKLAALIDDDSGAAGMEYGLIVAGISVAIVGVVFLIGEDIIALFELVQSYLEVR